MTIFDLMTCNRKKKLFVLFLSLCSSAVQSREKQDHMCHFVSPSCSNGRPLSGARRNTTFFFSYHKDTHFLTFLFSFSSMVSFSSSSNNAVRARTERKKNGRVMLVV
jgi:hypothetical protein